MQFHFHANQSHFHENGFAPVLALKQRHKGTWKWPIGNVCLTVCLHVNQVQHSNHRTGQTEWPVHLSTSSL